MQNQTPADSSSGPKLIRVAIVEDQSDIREGLRLLIDDAPEFRCVGAFGSFEEALSGLRPAQADIVLMDLACTRCRAPV